MQVSATDSSADRTPLKLPATLDFAAAEDLLVSMRERLQDGKKLRIDASGSETLTYPCIQVILSAMKTYDGISIVNPSVAFMSAFEDLALDWQQYQAPIDDDDTEAVQPEPEAAQQETDVPEMAAGEAPPLVQDQPAGGARPLRIMTIDDSKTMRDMLMLTLIEAGFDVLQGVDGQDGLEVLAKEPPVDIIITDINMPRMDGYEVIRQLRAKPEFQKTPILVLTTESETDKKNLARKIGATGWLVKPFDPDQLVETVLKVAPEDLRPN